MKIVFNSKRFPKDNPNVDITTATKWTNILLAKLLHEAIIVHGNDSISVEFTEEKPEALISNFVSLGFEEDNNIQMTSDAKFTLELAETFVDQSMPMIVASFYGMTPVKPDIMEYMAKELKYKLDNYLEDHFLSRFLFMFNTIKEVSTVAGETELGVKFRLVMNTLESIAYLSCNKYQIIPQASKCEDDDDHDCETCRAREACDKIKAKIKEAPAPLRGLLTAMAVSALHKKLNDEKGE